MFLHALRASLVAGLVILMLGHRSLPAQMAVSPATFGESVTFSNGSRVDGSDPFQAENLNGETSDGANGEIRGRATTVRGFSTVPIASNGSGSAGRVAASLWSTRFARGGGAAATISWSLATTPVGSGIPPNLTVPVLLQASGNGSLRAGRESDVPGVFWSGSAGITVSLVSNSILPGFVPFSDGGDLLAEGGLPPPAGNAMPRERDFNFNVLRTVQFPQNTPLRFSKTAVARASGDGLATAFFDPIFSIDPGATFDLGGETVRFADAFRLISSGNLIDPLRRPITDPSDTWRYLDDGSNQGALWRTADFNDAAWAEARAEFGFGDGDETTPIRFGDNPASKHITTYFRKEFQTDLLQGELDSLELDLILDGGAVIYLNGVEIHRNNLAPGAQVNSLALDEFEGLDEFRPQLISIDVATLPPGIWREGRNVLAAEVHLATVDDADLSFRLGLTAQTIPEPASMALVAIALALCFTSSAFRSVGHYRCQSTSSATIRQGAGLFSRHLIRV
jgi:hypothetical protein